MAPFSFSKSSGDRKRKDAPKKSFKRSPKPSNGRPSSESPKSRPQSSSRPGSSRSSSEKPKSRSSDQKDRRKPELKERQERRYRSFAVPFLPPEITGEELEKKKRAELRPLAEENALAVAKHLVAILRFLDTDPELAYRHAQEATFRAGRIALVREYAGMAALRSGRFDVAQKDLRAAHRISGSKELLPFIAQCEVALGNPRKALSIAGEVESKSLSISGQVELRIAAALARIALGQPEAAVVTLKCSELNRSSETWSKRLQRAYFDALVAAHQLDEANEFASNFPQNFQD